LTNCTIGNNENTGVYGYEGGSVVIVNSNITENTGQGIYSGNANVSNSTIRGNGAGIGGGNITISESSINENDGNGIVSTTVSSTNNTIRGNSVAGIRFSSVGSSGMTGNVITSNRYGVETTSNVSTLIFPAGNDIYSNSEYQLKNSGKAAVTANGNYWGEPTTSELKAGTANLTQIYDSRDNSNVGTVTITSYSEASVVSPTPTYTPIPTSTLIRNTPTATSLSTYTFTPTPASGVAMRVDSSSYVPGKNASVQINLQYEGTLTALGVSLTDLPIGWTFSRVINSNPAVFPSAGAVTPLEFSWIAVPVSPIGLNVILNVPTDETDTQTVRGVVRYRQTGPEIVIPFTVKINPSSYHSADTDQNWEISQSELLRVIQFYNMGGYHCVGSSSTPILTPTNTPTPSVAGVWQTMNSGTQETLYGIWGSSGNDVFAVGRSGIILHYDGIEWKSMSSGTSAWLASPWLHSPASAYVVGHSGTILHFNGYLWTPMNSGTNALLTSVWGNSETEVFAVGYSGTILHYNETSWSRMNSNAWGELTTVWGTSATDVYTVGDDGQILHYDGSTWTPMTNAATDHLSGLWGSSNTDIFAVGFSGTIIHYDGNTWEQMNSGTHLNFSSIWGNSATDVYAVGDEGMILHYDGNSWTPITTGVTKEFFCVWGSSQGDVFAVGDDGTILHHKTLLSPIPRLTPEPIYQPDSFTEDGYIPGPGTNHSCAPHNSDYNPQDWMINQSELLRLIQFYNSGGYYADASGEDGFASGHSTTGGKVSRSSVYPYATGVSAIRDRAVEGSTAVITVTITHGGNLTALGVQEVIPAGWTFDSMLSGGVAIAPSQGSSGILEFTWLTVPSSPITLSYKVNIETDSAQAPINGVVRFRTTGSEETVNISEASTQSTPTPTPTQVSQPSAPTSTPVTSVKHVFIYDNAGDTTGDLSGQTDFDAVDNRNLTIAWDASQGSAADWHIYLRKGLGGANFLGRTASGAATSFDWNAENTLVSADYANGPDFNSVYSFRVVRIDGQLGADDLFDGSAPVGFNLEGGNAISLAKPELPNLNPGQIVIYDDILGGNDLAPSGSTGSDTDKSSSRALQIAWNFGRDASTVNEYHIMVSDNGGEFTYLGQTYDGTINYYWWTPKREFRAHANFADGPQNGHTYQFRVILMPLTGTRANLTSGILQYSVAD
jgi:hypothetical protein